MPSKKRTLTCTLQNTLGALDRVLGLLTHRGLLPDSFESYFNRPANTIEVKADFDCEQDVEFLKLVKAIEKQITVLSVSPSSLTLIQQQQQSTVNSL